MSDLDDSVRLTKEYLDEAQQVIEKIKDTLASLNKLINKNSEVGPPDAKRLARQAQLQEGLQALVQGYLGEASSTPDESAAAHLTSSPPSDNSTTRPGRFRPRI